MSPIEHDTLINYGNVFQIKALSAIISDVGYFEQIQDILESKYFDSEYHQWIVGKIKWYYRHYKSIPSLEVFKVEIYKEDNENYRIQLIESLRKIYVHIESTDLQYVKDKILEFCKNQSLKNAILESADLLSNQEYDKIESLIKKSIQAGAPRDPGHVWKMDIEKRLSENVRNTIPTGWEIIDTLMNGGLGRGELGTIIAPSGIGKSWSLSRIGIHALKMGLNVLHYTMELNEDYVGIRYDSMLINQESNKMKDFKSVLEKEIEKIPGHLQIKYYPARTANASMLAADINIRKANGFHPDLVLIDYADLMRSIDKTSNRYEELGYIYEDIRSVFGELSLPVWTVSQTQRSSLNEDIIEADKIADSFAKIMKADFVMSLSRKLEDKLSNSARGHIIKNRFGPDGITVMAEFDTSRGIVELYDMESPKGQMIKKKMTSGESELKAFFREKYQEQEKYKFAGLDSSNILNSDDDLG